MRDDGPQEGGPLERLPAHGGQVDHTVFVCRSLVDLDPDLSIVHQPAQCFMNGSPFKAVARQLEQPQDVFQDLVDRVRLRIEGQEQNHQFVQTRSP